MNKQMMAAVLYGKEQLQIESVAVPQIGKDDVLVRVRTALTCGTDVKVFRRGYHARMIVPPAVPAFTFTTTWKFVRVPGARLAIVHVILPVPPTAGVTHAHPTGVVAETNVVFAGVACVKLTVAALLGPRFVTVCV